MTGWVTTVKTKNIQKTRLVKQTTCFCESTLTQVLLLGRAEVLKSSCADECQAAFPSLSSVIRNGNSRQ